MITRAEKIELALVLLATGGLAVMAVHLPAQLELGSFLAVAALALLGQGLIRDLWLLAKQRKVRDTGHREEARCMCLESTVGLSGVLAGILLTALAIPVSVRMADWAWPLAGGLIWVAGFAIKDVVIQWSPWKLRRVKDHGSILVRWR
jgi:sterol desaturase/sphingolipid hydroxylase (fatty acid hydroxylase superfamily)